jgi:protein-S-isoprenylcysteine O-methyltransferase Ste14
MNIFQPANALFFAGLVIQMVIRQQFIQRTQSETKKLRQIDGIEKTLLAIVAPAALLLPPLYCFSSLLSFANYELLNSVRWVGAAVMLASLWLFWRSHIDLGQNWSASLELRQGHQLVTHGVYRRIRHPMYASLWLWGLAQALMLANWLAGWSMILAFAAMYFVRKPREERLMYQEFGESYNEYCQRTGNLIPRLTQTAKIEQSD